MTATTYLVDVRRNKSMATTKEYKEYAVAQLERIGDITCRPMMGEYLLYLNGQLFGGLYDSRVLIKKTENNEKFGLLEALPYKGAKMMYHLQDMDDIELIEQVVTITCKDLKK